MSASVQVPADLRREFRQFRADFEAVWLCWIEAGEETEPAYAQAKEEAVRWISESASGPDAEERLRGMFGHWSELRSRVAPIVPPVVAVVPGYSEAELLRMQAARQQGVR